MYWPTSGGPDPVFWGPPLHSPMTVRPTMAMATGLTGNLYVYCVWKCVGLLLTDERYSGPNDSRNVHAVPNLWSALSTFKIIKPHEVMTQNSPQYTDQWIGVILN